MKSRAGLPLRALGPNWAPPLPLQELTEREDAKVMAAWWLGDELSKQLLEHVAQASRVLNPLQHDFVKQRREALSDTCRKLEAQVTEGEEVDDVAFYASYSAAKLAAVRKLRNSATSILREITADSKIADEFQEVAEAKAITKRAKYHSLKWGLLAVTAHADVKTATKCGLDLRTKLRELLCLVVLEQLR